MTTATTTQTTANTAAGRRGGTETELRAAARRRGLTIQELAERMGVSAGYLSMVATGRRPWTANLREKAVAALGEVPGQGVVHRRVEEVAGESSYIRERARALGMSMRELAERVGVSSGYITNVSRGRRTLGVKTQGRVESALRAPAKVEPARPPSVDQRVVWDRMDALGVSQNEVARCAGVSSGHLSQIMSGRRRPSPRVLRRLHHVLFLRTVAEERVVPAEVEVLGWRKGERRGMVVRGAGRGTVRSGGRAPWGAEVEYAYRAGYDARGRVSVTHVTTPGIAVMLTPSEPAAA